MNPLATPVINIPQLVNDKSLAAYACPIFSALIKLWNIEMERMTGNGRQQVRFRLLTINAWEQALRGSFSAESDTSDQSH